MERASVLPGLAVDRALVPPGLAEATSPGAPIPDSVRVEVAAAMQVISERGFWPSPT